MSDHELPKSVVSVDRFEHSPINSTPILNKDGHGENNYHCPFCAEKRAKHGKEATEDTAGKLYINTYKNVGYCFRCNTVVLVGFTVDNAIENLVKTLEFAFKENEEVEFETLTLNYPLACDNKDAMSWIQARNPVLTPDIIRMLDARWYERVIRKKSEITGEFEPVNRRGILFPIRIKNEIKSFQIRFLTDVHAERFYTLNGAKLCWSLFPNQTKMSEISICEGVFSAIAAGLMQFKQPLALLGKTITPLQINQLRDLLPIKVNLLCDTPEINWKLFHEVRKKLPTVEEIKVVKLGNNDPEEYFLKKGGYR